MVFHSPPERQTPFKPVHFDTIRSMSLHMDIFKGSSEGRVDPRMVLVNLKL